MAGQPADGPRFSTPEESQLAHRRRRRRVLLFELGAALVAGAVVLAVVLLVADDDESAEARDDGLEHTSVSSCSTDAEGFATAEVAITNGSDEYSDYLVELAFLAPDGTELEVRNANVHGVRVGETATEEVRSAEPLDVEDVSCEVRSAFRFFAGAAPRG